MKKLIGIEILGDKVLKQHEQFKDIILREKNLDRWAEDIDHHPMSEKIMKFLMAIDFENYDDMFCWKKGGDGDNGEVLMYQLDAFFEAKDKGELD